MILLQALIEWGLRMSASAPETKSSWFSSGWFIGVTTSLIAGGVISLISYLSFSRRKRLEYLQRVLMANREVTYAVRAGIAENYVPAVEIVESLANATARRYGLTRVELYTPAELADELTKEVMDSSFLASSQKIEYCSRLSPLWKPASEPSESTAPEKEGLDISLIGASLAIGAPATGMVAGVNFVLQRMPKGLSFDPAVIALVISFFLVFVTLALLYLRRLYTVRVESLKAVAEAEKDLQDFFRKRWKE